MNSYSGNILTRKFNIDKRKLHYSALIRSNQITRDTAFKKIMEDPFKGGINSIIYNIKKLDLTEAEFDEIMQSQNKSFIDYPSYYNLIKKLELPIRFGSKLGLVPEVVIQKFFNF